MQEINGPVLSVVMGTFNESPNHLIESLSSIRNQTFSNFECILIDDSTNFESIDVARKFCDSDQRFIYIKPEKRLGLAASLNLGMSLARGLFIARFDADDVNEVFRFERQINFLLNNLDIDVVGSNIKIIDDFGNLIAYRIYQKKYLSICLGMQFKSTIANPTVMFRKSALLTGGNYNQKFSFSEDLEIWLRWMNRGLKFENMNDYLVLYRKPNTYRPQKHWIMNLYARFINISFRFFPFNLIGIVCVFLWALIPALFQRFLYNFFTFKNLD